MWNTIEISKVEVFRRFSKFFEGFEVRMANLKQIQRFVSKIKCPDPGKLVKLCSYLSSCHFLAVLFTIFTKIWITKNFKTFFLTFFCFYLLPEKLLQLYQNFCKVYQISKKIEKFSFKVCWFQLFLVTILASVFFPFWGHFLPKCIKSNQFGQSFR